MKKALALALSLSLLGCSGACQAPSKPTVAVTPGSTCMAAVRLQDGVAVMFANEWLTGRVAVAVCRGSKAENDDLLSFVKWLDQQARTGRMRRCGTNEARRPVSEPDRLAAASVLPGIQDWCLDVVADI
jgi:hypothetical protein